MAIVVHPVFAAVDAVRDGPDRLRHLALGTRVNGLHRLFHPGDAMLGREFVQPPPGNGRRGDLGEDVALALFGAAHIGQDQIELLRIEPVRRDQAGRRQPQPFLPGVARGGKIAARHRAADVRPVGERHGEGVELAFPEDRADQLHVRQVVAADLGQIDDPDIARLHAVGGDPLEEFAHGEAEHAEMNRDVRPLCDEEAFRVRQGGGMVAGLAQQGRTRRAHHHHRHLLGNRRECVADDFEGNGFDAHSVTSIMRLPLLSAVTRSPGGTTTVDHSSSMTSGPSSATPTGRRLRWRTATSSVCAVSNVTCR